MSPHMANDPLANLKPIHLPAEPSWFPPALGWWICLLLILGALAAIWIWWRRRRQRRAPLMQALQELEALKTEYSDAAMLAPLNQLLRRAAGQRHGAQVAALSVSDWAIFLAENAPEELQADEQIWRELAESAYRQNVLDHSGEHLACASAWLRENLQC